MITIVDYGLGNVGAFRSIFKQLNIPCRMARNKDQLAGSEKLILPGVGSFDWAITKLSDSGMRDELDCLVIGKNVPVLGVCVGMQMMANKSEEGSCAGLGWIDGEVQKIPETAMTHETFLPHMGWNSINPNVSHPLLSGLESDAIFYFLHSYHILPASEDEILTETNYGSSFCSSVFKGNIFGTQFHPEKSHSWGVKLLHNFSLMQ